MGITRASIIAIAKQLGLAVVSKRLTRDDIYIADECFFSGTAAEVTPVRELDGRQIGIGSRGPVTHKIQNAFFDIVNGRDKKYAKWLTPIAAGKTKDAGKKAKPGKAAAKPAAKKAKK
jgi:branched-chain amino acid aminotransferase